MPKYLPYNDGTGDCLAIGPCGDPRYSRVHESWKDREARRAALHRDVALSALIAWRMQQEEQHPVDVWTCSTVVPADGCSHDD